MWFVQRSYKRPSKLQLVPSYTPIAECRSRNLPRPLIFPWRPSATSREPSERPSSIPFRCSSEKHCRLVASFQPSSEFLLVSFSCVSRLLHCQYTLFSEAWPMPWYPCCRHWRLCAIYRMRLRARLLFSRWLIADHQSRDMSSAMGGVELWSRGYETGKTWSFSTLYETAKF